MPAGYRGPITGSFGSGFRPGGISGALEGVSRGHAVGTPMATLGTVSGKIGEAQDRENRLQLANIAQTPARLEQQRFQAVFPWLKSQIGDIMGQFSSTVGGQSPAGPHISAGPILGPDHLQQSINAQRARGDQQLATQNRVLGRQMAGMGMSARSPLAMALQNQAGMANRAQQATGERELRLGSAQMNAEHLLNAQRAREQQFASRQQEDIERRRTLTGLFPGLLSAVGGLV